MSRVLHVVYSYYESDPRTRRMTESLARRGHEVDVVALRAQGTASHEVLEGVRVERLDMERQRGGQAGYLACYGRFLAKASTRVVGLHRQRRYDVIHVHTMPDLLVLAALWPRVRGATVLLDFHDMMPELFEEKFGSKDALVVRLLWRMERWSAHVAHHCLAVHELQRRRLVANGIPEEKLTVVLNAPDDRLFGPWPRGDHAGVLFAYHGTIAPRHGVDLAVRAFAIARQQRDDLRFRIVGSGDGVESVRAAIAELRLGPWVELLDPVPIDRVPHVIGPADVGVIPLRGGPAGDLLLPTKLLEYSALGIPSIVTRTPIVEHYYPEDSVVFVPGADVDALAQAMVALASDASLRHRIVESARCATDKISFAVQDKTYSALIDRLSAPRRRSASAPS